VNVTYILFCSGRICSEHFDASCYDKPAQQKTLHYSPLRGRKLRLDAIPTLNLFADRTVAKPSTTSPKQIENIATTEPTLTSTTESPPATLDSIGEALNTEVAVASVDYPTIV